MNPDTWKWALAFAIGSAIGLGLRRGLRIVFGQGGSALSVSTVTLSSILGGFCGAAIAWVMASPSLSQDAQTLVIFGMLGVMATIAADAAAAQATIDPGDRIRLGRRVLVHIGVGIAAALIAIPVVRSVMSLGRR
jgi:fluoride ion exporter CrcB/FEX